MNKRRNQERRDADVVESPPTHAEDPILTPEEVGRRIGKTGQTVRNWIRDGLLEVVRMPNELPGVRQSEVNKLLAGSAMEVEA